MAKTPRYNRPAAPPPPGDIALMNTTALVFASLGAILVVATMLLWFVHQPVFALRAIRIEGDMTRNSVSTIRANAAPHLAGNFFTMDLAAGRRAFESVPWVRRAVVTRVWPNRLRVRLEEHRPVALWTNEGDAERLVDSYGEVFEANLGDVEDDALPTLQGPEGSAAHVLALFGRIAPIFAGLDAHIDTLALSARGSWRAELDSGAEVQLGRGSDDEVIERTQRFAGTLSQVLARYQRPLESADLRHNDGYAVRLKGITTTSGNADKAQKK
ncbi:MAG: cell division protein FtsQ/DivIB [Caldimonas sp.]